MSGNTKSGNSRGERFEHYGDHTFKGHGIIKCNVCKEPLRDHPMRPCENLGARVIHTAPAARITKEELAKRISAE